MFSRKDQLLRKTGPDGIGRYDFLKLLKKEFETTAEEEPKKQILANLCNFAYDPINYDYIRSLQILDIFLEHLSSNNEIFVKFSVAALCNLSADPINRDYILQNNGIQRMFHMLTKEDENIILDSVATLMFLRTRKSKCEIYLPVIVNKIEDIRSKRSKRLFNLASVFLEDYSSETIKD